MKRLAIAAAGLALAVVALAACTREVEKIVMVTPTQAPVKTTPMPAATPTPKYMPDEVITLVKDAPAPFDTGQGAQTVYQFARSICASFQSDEQPLVLPSFQATYMGNGRWEVESQCMASSPDPKTPLARIPISPGAWRFLEDGNEVIRVDIDIGRGVPH